MIGDNPVEGGHKPEPGIQYDLLADSGPKAPVYAAGQTTHTQVLVDGKMRTADVHVPQSWDGKSPLPTLYYFKALHQGGPEPESFTGLSAQADKLGAAVVYLDGEGWWNSWNNGQRDFGAGADENSYLNAVHNRLSQELPLDQDRQGLGGFSHGGNEAYVLAAKNKWVSSVQSDEGYMSGYEDPLTRPISQQTIHDLRDPVIPYGGTAQVERIANQEALDQATAASMGVGYVDVMGALHALEASHERNGNMIQSQSYLINTYNVADGMIDPATGKARAPLVSQNGDITTRRWINPATGAENRQVTLGSGTHGFAGSTDHSNDFPLIGVPNEELSAASEMLRFLKDHPLIKPGVTSPVLQPKPPAVIEKPEVTKPPLTPVLPDQTAPPPKVEPPVPVIKPPEPLPFEGTKVTALEPGINPRLGCGEAVSAALHAQDSRIAVTDNVDQLKRNLHKLGYQMLVRSPGAIKPEDLQSGDVLLGYRQGHMPRHAAIYKGQGQVFENNSNTGTIIGNGDVNEFNQKMHDAQGNFMVNGFERVIILRRPGS